MREFTLLDDVELKMLDGERLPETKEKTIGHVAFLLQRLTDPQATSCFDDLCKALKIRDALVAAKAKNTATKRTVKLEDEQWKLLCLVLKTPQGGYAIYGHCVVPFARAVLDAVEVGGA